MKKNVQAMRDQLKVIFNILQSELNVYCYNFRIDFVTINESETKNFNDSCNEFRIQKLKQKSKDLIESSNVKH